METRRYCLSLLGLIVPPCSEQRGRVVAPVRHPRAPVASGASQADRSVPRSLAPHLLTGALLLSLGPWASSAPVPVAIDNNGISAFELFGSGIYWWSAHGVCGTEFPHDAGIRLRGTMSSGTKTLESSCGILNSYSDTVARDDAYAYFFSNRQLMRKALNAAAGDPAQVMATAGLNPTLPAGQLGAALELAQSQLYWARTSGNTSDFYRMPTDGSSGPQYFLTIVNGGGGEVVKMKWIHFDDGAQNVDGLVILFSNGNLWRFKLYPTGILNFVAGGVSDFTLHTVFNLFGNNTTTIYVAVGETGLVTQNSAPGKLLAVNLSSGATSTLYTAAGINQIIGVTTDSDESIFATGTKNLYLAEGVVTCALFCTVSDVVLRRHALPAGPNGWDLILASGGGGNLRSDDSYLYFTVTNSIKRLATDAPALELDVAADALEVVQAIQDLNSSISLVANHPTYVRGYAHLVTNTTGQATWFPSASLRGFLNGVELPGSPIDPVNNPVVDRTNDLGVLRSDLTHCFLFELPDEWVKPGPLPLNLNTLSFSMTVNPMLSLPETPTHPLANNTVTSVPATLVKKGWPCIVPVRIYSTGPDYDFDNPNFRPNFERARSLMPVEDFSVFAYAATEPVGDPTEPFDMLDPDEDHRNDTADDILDAVEDVDLDSDPCDDSDDGHYLGMMHKDAVLTPGVIGVAWRNDQNCWITMFDGAINGHGPGGGEDMAHELGHNYGRRHIQCGDFPADQADFDFVPFPATLGFPTRNLTSSPFGFDSINLNVIPPDTACDVMSYGNPKWASIWYWSALLSQTAQPLARPHLLAAAAPLPGNQVLLMSGRVEVSNQVALLRSFKLLPESAAPPKKVALSRLASANAATSPNPYTVRFLDSQGALLGEAVLALKESSNHNEKRGERLHIGQYVDWPLGTRSLQVAHGNSLLAERFVSPHAPLLTLGAPVLDTGAETLSLSWTAADPDGDPLRFSVQYSSDDGSHWLALASNLKPLELTVSTRRLPGGTRCLLRVTASDGINCTLATTPPFALARHAPEAYISGVLEGERIPFGTLRKLVGHALDAESGSRSNTLVWNLSSPVSLVATSAALSLRDVPPGPCSVTLTAQDPDGQTGAATRHFEILPLRVPEGPAPTLDGLPNDSGYAQAAFVRLPLGASAFAPVRLLHAGNNLYVSFDKLSYAANARLANRKVGLRVDPNASRDPLGQAGDLGFFVDEDGIPSQEAGIGSGMAVTLSPKPGFTAVIHRGSNSWSAELRIADALLGGWNHAAGLMLVHDNPHWPPLATANSPASWAPVFLGTNPPLPANRLPTANAGHNQRLPLRAPRTLRLDGTASHDPDGDPLTFRWRQLTGPPVTLVNSNSPTPTLPLAPVSTPTLLTFELRVSDGTGDSAPATVQVVLLPPPSTPPTPPAHGFATLRGDGQLQVRLVANPRQKYRLEMSPDLTHWSPLRTLYADFSGRIDVTQAVDLRAHDRLFFRAVSP
jgi:hypothetical protein